MIRSKAKRYTRLAVTWSAMAASLALTGPVSAGVYEVPSQKAAEWLESQQDVSDGSWGTTPALKQLNTVAATRALHALNHRNAAYFAGLAWIKNHDSGNNDYLARRAVLLMETGASISVDAWKLLASQRTAFPGNNGWGVTAAYNGSALDTALALQAVKAAGLAVDTTSAIAYLKTSQLTGTDKGWSISQNGTSDATTNAQVIIALSPYLPNDTTLATPLANAATTLGTQVGDTSPVQLRALAAQALLLRDPASSKGMTLLNGVSEQQGANGDWGGDVYATAGALQAMALAEGRDIAAQRVRVAMPDGILREAVNLALGRGALDQLNRGELARLTSLDISNLGVTSLAGLEYATNLTSLHAAGNSIADTTPISDLVALTDLDLNGNPCPGCTQVASNDGDVPLPGWALVLLGSSLLGAIVRKKARKHA